MQEDPKVRAIIENLIAAAKVSGLLNRNPTIAYESIIYVKVVKCIDGFALRLSDFIILGCGGDEWCFLSTCLQRTLLNKLIVSPVEVLPYGNMWSKAS